MFQIFGAIARRVMQLLFMMTALVAPGMNQAKPTLSVSGAMERLLQQSKVETNHTLSVLPKGNFSAR
ncbi:hypothetical protein [Geobacter metallireducens]|uniref:hypothetical protein n=1 Tax=Geobacter metallireducens TaxID=28232 RepID=UPI00164F0028|nr:hypothetical protein [Geobacter metallireducens]